MILGTGIDVVEIDRFGHALERRGVRMRMRLFTESEQRYCEENAHSAPHFAVRFAAKEAFAKALGRGIAEGIRWLDVEVTRDEAGRPAILLHGRAKERFVLSGGRTIHVSLSHSRNIAIASVVLEGEAPS